MDHVHTIHIIIQTQMDVMLPTNQWTPCSIKCYSKCPSVVLGVWPNVCQADFINVIDYDHDHQNDKR